MKKIIFLISFLKIRKQEFPEIIYGVIRIVEKHNPATLYINGMFNLLLELQSKIAILTEKRASHPITSVLDVQRKRRMKLTVSIVLQAQAVEKAAVGSLSDAVNLIVPVIKKHFLYLSRENAKVVHQEVNNYFAKLNGNDELVLAATAIGINIFNVELKAVQESIEINSTLRTESKAPSRSINKKQIKAEIIAAYDRLISSIELARVEHSGIDYTPLVNDLNEFIVIYQTLIKARSTRSKNAQKTTTVATSTTTSTTAI